MTFNKVLQFPLFLFTSFSTILTTMGRNEINSSQHPEYFPTTLEKKAVSLVVHGLNVKPAAMLGLIAWLNAQGSDAYLINLMGHNEKSGQIADVTAELWEKNMQGGYEVANRASRDS
jgi:esterase/lipase